MSVMLNANCGIETCNQRFLTEEIPTEVLFYESQQNAPSTGYPSKSIILKGLRHEDFAVLGQFCAKSITYCL